jgi:hypothetical protein
MIPCIVIPAHQASPFRQAKENTARSGLTAIAMARQAALLMLTVHGYEIPASAVTNDFYRQALDLSLQSKQEFSTQVLTAMGSISRMHLSRYKALLKLSDEAMDLADRYNIEEGKLRHIIMLDSEYHLELVRQVVDLNLTSKQIKEICETGDIHTDDNSQASETIPRPALQMAKAVRNSATTTGQDFARALLQQDRNIHLARARIETMRRVLDDAEQHLRDE